MTNINNRISQLEYIDVISKFLSFIHAFLLASSLHFTHHNFFQIVKHSFLFHTWGMFFSYSLSLNSKLLSLLGIFLDFIFNVLLVTSLVKKSFATTFNVIIFLIQSLHLKLNKLIFELIEFYFSVHSIDLISKFINNSFYLFNVVFYLCSYS